MHNVLTQCLNLARTKQSKKRLKSQDLLNTNFYDTFRSINFYVLKNYFSFIVTGSIQEPVPGWIDNFYGIVGITCAAAIGVLRTLHCDPSNYAQIIPVDYVSNCIMAVCHSISNEK